MNESTVLLWQRNKKAFAFSIGTLDPSNLHRSYPNVCNRSSVPTRNVMRVPCLFVYIRKYYWEGEANPQAIRRIGLKYVFSYARRGAVLCPNFPHPLFQVAMFTARAYV